MFQKRMLSTQQKALILREFLENQTPISQLAERHNIHVNDIYNWKKKLLILSKKFNNEFIKFI